MKNPIRNSIVLVMLFTMLTSNATEISSLKNIEDGKTTLVLNNVKAGEELIIKDLFGVVLYRESIKDNGIYSKSFDLTELPDGNYNFELDRAVKIEIIPFKVSSKTVTFNKESEIVIYKPFVRLKDNFIYISQLSLNKKPLHITLYYNESNQIFNSIYTETITDTTQIKRILKLLEDKRGAYKVILKCEGRTFENVIRY
ncbi:hypothetical protein [Lacinutrix chionoecetis]